MTTKREKRIWSILLAMVMVITTVFANMNATSVVSAAQKVAVEAEQVEAGQTIVHFKPTSIKTPYIWAYSGETNYTKAGKWPGDAMTKEDNGWYSYTIEADKASVIFNDNGGEQEPAAEKPGYEFSGEVWYVQGSNGKFTTEEPDGDGTPKPTGTAKPTPSASAQPTQSGEPSEQPSKIISIEAVTPGEGDLKVNEEVTLKTEINLDKKIDYAYYKYEVKYDGAYVGDHYYTKNAEYKFKPEKEGTYTIEVFAQAHDMENSTAKKTITYEVKENVEETDKPSESPAVSGTPAPSATTAAPSASAVVSETPGQSKKPEQSETPGQSGTPVPSATVVPSAPVSSQTPTESPKPTDTDKPAVSPSSSAGTKTAPPSDHPQNTKTPTVTPTLIPTTVPSAQPGKITAKVTLSKKTPQYRGRAIKIKAKVSGESNAEYKFTLVNEKTKSVKTLQKFSSNNTVTWRPGKNDIGTYRIYVYVRQEGTSGILAIAKSSKITIKKKKLSIDSTSISKKKSYYTIAANTAGGYGTLKYKYVVKNKKGKIVFKTAYSKKRTAKWKARKGTYKIYTYVKDSKTKKTKTMKKTIK